MKVITTFSFKKKYDYKLIPILCFFSFNFFAQEESSQSKSIWPVPKFYFSVDMGSDSGIGEVPFQEVSGLDIESQIIEYRAGNDPRFSTVKMPGLNKSGSVTMKKGMFKDDNAFREWYGEIKMNTIARTTITIKLLDESGSPTMTWVLKNAWPTKISVTDLNGDSNEVAIESIEISHEGMTITN